MSFVIATPDLVQSAAADLAGVRSSLAEAGINIPNITIEPITIGQFLIPPATAYYSTLVSNVNSIVSELEFIGSSLTGVGAI